MTTVVELQKAGIRRVVDRMELGVLADHIVKILHEMTTENPNANRGKLPVHTRDLIMHPVAIPLITACTRYTGTYLAPSGGSQSIAPGAPSAVRFDHGRTLPEGTIYDGGMPNNLRTTAPMGLVGGITSNHYAFDAFADAWLEDWTTEEARGSPVHVRMPFVTTAGFSFSTFSRASLFSSQGGEEKYAGQLNRVNRCGLTSPVEQDQLIPLCPHRAVQRIV